MSSELILVVCAANVCRSPLAEFMLRRGLEGVPGIRVMSAGTRAQDDAGVCPLVAQWRDDEAWAAESGAHRSHRADPDLLEEAALILVSSRDVRADVVLMAPEVRGRTYTLREAAHLGVEFESLSQPSHVGAVARYATHLDRARVVRGTVPGAGRHWGRKSPAGGPDIVDGHGRRQRAHRRALGEIRDATNGIVGQLGGDPV